MSLYEALCNLKCPLLYSFILAKEFQEKLPFPCMENIHIKGIKITLRSIISTKK